jgi:hypothetical protein
MSFIITKCKPPASGPDYSPITATQSLYFDGSADAATIADHADFTNNSWTAGGWFKVPDNQSSWPFIYGHWYYLGGDLDAAWGFFPVNTDESKMRVSVCKVGDLSTYKAYNTSVEVNDGFWHHFCIVVTYGSPDMTLQLFVDGVEDTGVTKVSDQTQDVTLDSAHKLTIGAQNDGTSKFAEVTVKDLCYWNDALSAAQVSEWYQGCVLYNLNTHTKNANLIQWQKYETDSHHSDADGLIDASAAGSAHPGTGISLTAGSFVSDVPSFHPKQVRNLKLWYRADLGVTKDGSDRVSAWADQSGNGYNASQGTGSLQPLWVDNADPSSSHPIIRFADDPMGIGSSAILNTGIAHTVFLIHKLTSVAGTGNIILCLKDETAGFPNFQYRNSPEEWWYNGGSGPWVDSKYDVGTIVNTWQYIRFHFDGVDDTALGSFSFYEDGTQITTEALAGGSGTSNAIGGHKNTSDTNFNYYGDIAECIIYASTPTAAEIALLQTYFNTRYGL